MFDFQTDNTGFHLLDPTNTEALNDLLGNEYPDSQPHSVPELLSLEPVALSILGEVSQSSPDQITLDPLTGESLTPNQFLLPINDDSLITAQDLGVINETRIISDFVGDFDQDDYYRIQLNTPSDLTLDLDGLVADADLELIADYNGNGFVEFNEVIDYSWRWDNLPENISAINLYHF